MSRTSRYFGDYRSKQYKNTESVQQCQTTTAKKRNRKMRIKIPKVMIQLDHEYARSHADDAVGSLDVLHSLKESLQGQVYITIQNGMLARFPVRTEPTQTFPGQSKHLMRHWGNGWASTFRNTTSKRSLVYLICIASIASVNHCGRWQQCCQTKFH